MHSLLDYCMCPDWGSNWQDDALNNGATGQGQAHFIMTQSFQYIVIYREFELFLCNKTTDLNFILNVFKLKTITKNSDIKT